MFTIFNRLPTELRLRIIVESCDDSDPPLSYRRTVVKKRIAHLAAISRDWKDVVESQLFSRQFTLCPEDLDEFDSIVTGRRTRLIKGITLKISLATIDAHFWAAKSHTAVHQTVSPGSTNEDSWATHTQEDSNTIDSFTQWFANQKGRDSGLIYFSIAVNNIFKRLFQILASWPEERSQRNLLTFRYSIEGGDKLRGYRSCCGGPSPSRPMLLLDFGTLPQVSSIGAVYDGHMSEHDDPVLHPHATLALLKRSPQAHKAGISLGSGQKDWLLDAIETMKYLPTCGHRLKQLYLRLLQPQDWDQGLLAPDTACPDYQALSASVVQLRVTMPQLQRLNIDYAVDVQMFFSAILGETGSKHPGALPRWPRLQRLGIKGYYNGEDDALLTSDEARNCLFGTLGKSIAHFPDLVWLEVSVEAKPCPANSDEDEYDGEYDEDDNDDLYISFSQEAPQVQSLVYPCFNPKEAVIMIQGFIPRREEAAVWKKVVSQERHTDLALCMPNSLNTGWTLIKYDEEETMSASRMEDGS